MKLKQQKRDCVLKIEFFKGAVKTLNYSA